MAIRINGELLPQSAVDYELGRLIQFYSGHMSETEVRNQMPELQRKAQQQAIGAKLLLDQAAKMDIRVPQADVEKHMNETIAKLGGAEKFQARLDRQKMSADAVRQGIVQGRKVDLLIERLTEGLSDPTEEEIREHYDTHPEEYTRPDRAAAQHILIGVAKGEGNEARAAATSRLEAIRREIQQGVRFEELAATHSECPSGKSDGGSLGWFSQGMMVPEFDQTVFPMRVGELSPVIETPLGFHLVRKTGHEDGGKLAFNDVHDNIREFLRHAARGTIIAEHVSELTARAVIEITDDEAAP